MDFLCPFHPVHISEFLAIAPHPMSYSNFEVRLYVPVLMNIPSKCMYSQVAQWDILEALDYQINMTTPDAILEELRLSLPTLRHLLSFDNGWCAAREHAWFLLKAAALGEKTRFFLKKTNFDE